MTTVGLPAELKPELDYSLPAGMSCYQVRVTPANLSQVQSSTQTLTASSNINISNTSSNIIFEIPSELKVATSQQKGDNPRIFLEGIDKQLLGQVAAKIRGLRKPEPYKGKGVKYKGEFIRRKAGKAAGK